MIGFGGLVGSVLALNEGGSGSVTFMAKDTSLGSGCVAADERLNNDNTCIDGREKLRADRE